MTEVALDRNRLRDLVLRYTRFTLAKEWEDLTPRERLLAVSLAVREPVLDAMLETEKRQLESGSKQVHYLSMEFLMGRSLGNNLVNLGLDAECRAALDELGVDLDTIAGEEADAALGNGGLGRLAACFLDSMATLGIDGHGYGINYDFGLFRQEIVHGYQKERADVWRLLGSPWALARPDEACIVPLYGKVVDSVDLKGAYNPMWLNWKVLVGMPYDLPVVGYGGKTVNRLRLFAARSANEIDMSSFNDGEFVKAVEDKVTAENVSKVLYPNDLVEEGRELRLVQEYFFVACALRDILKRFDKTGRDLKELPDHAAIQMNDTHPAIAVAELMRVLVDERGLAWDTAFEITQGSCAYTNHTLMPEALERWPESLMRRVLPRHLQIIEEINRRFLEEVDSTWPDRDEKREELSIFEEGDEKRVRMAHLAIVGSHSVNGVSELHSQLITERLVPGFHELWPERFNSKTNGVTPRRWIVESNPGLASLCTETLGDSWITDLEQLRGLEAHAQDPEFLARLRQIKLDNKRRLAAMVHDLCRVHVDPSALFDVQAKRIHEYKRQLLAALRIAWEYLMLVEDGVPPACPKVYLFAGKAAPSYQTAKLIIKLITSIAEVVNKDPKTRDWMRVAFLPDYRVSLAQTLIPGADLSEQISTAGTEASGTGNMKFCMNGGLIMGTLDGANIEIKKAVGEDNIFIFGHRADEIETLKGNYDPRAIVDADPALKRCIDAIADDRFSRHEPGLFRWVRDKLLDPNEGYFHLADFSSYCAAQENAGRAFLHGEEWARRSLFNITRCGGFSSDRTIREYAQEIWGV